MMRSKLLKLAVLAELFSLPDYAMEILSFARTVSSIDSEEEARLLELANSNQIVARHYRHEYASE